MITFAEETDGWRHNLAQPELDQGYADYYKKAMEREAIREAEKAERATMDWFKGEYYRRQRALQTMNDIDRERSVYWEYGM